jgi:HPt (histidine-containing phosphotransfer) domain-containing protein
LRQLLVKIEASRRQVPKELVNQFHDCLISRAWFPAPGSAIGRLMPPPPPRNPSPSPPLVREAPIDVEHLARMTLGDGALRREVLAMFLKQTDELLVALAARPGEGAAVAHTLKGSARAIGAFRVAACAAALEGVIRQGGDPSQDLAALEAAVAAASCSIEAILAQP